MKEHVMKDLRKCCSVKGKQETWVSRLDDDQLWELFLRLRNEESARDIARHALNVWGFNPKSSVHSISQGILKFKKRISHLLLSPPPDLGLESVATADPDCSLEVLENIARLHRSRIQRMMIEEDQTAVRYPHLNRDIQALSSLEKTLMQRKEWEAKNDDPTEVRKSNTRKRKIDAIFDGLMKGVKGDGSSIISATEQIIQLAEKKSITLETEEDGSIPLNKNKEAPDETRDTDTAA
jgi:hypothetical protein